MSELIVYVDGFNLYHGMKAKFGRRLLWLDLVTLSTRLRPKAACSPSNTSRRQSSTTLKPPPDRDSTSARCWPMAAASWRSSKGATRRRP